MIKAVFVRFSKFSKKGNFSKARGRVESEQPC